MGGTGRYGDHGGLLIVTKHETEGPADSVLFSIDQGTCWHEIGLEEAIDVGNIRRAPVAATALKPGPGPGLALSASALAGTHRAC